MKDKRPVLLSNDWFAAWMDTAAWDNIVRIFLLGFLTLSAVQASSNILEALRETGTALDAPGVLRVTAMALVLVQFGLVVVLVITRLRPVAKSPGLYPRAVAFAGSYSPLLIPMLPRAADSFTINLISAACLCIGCGLMFWVFLNLSRSMSMMAEARRLVTTGPYRFIRHPAYVIEAIYVIGSALQYRSWTVLAILLAHFLFQYLRMLNEERILERTFPEYADYRARVPRLIPGLH